MTDLEQREKIVRYWWSQAEESLASVQRELEAGALTFAVNRLYYAVFYGVSAALFERKLSFKRHSAVRAAFHREFVKTGLLDTQWGKLYDQLFEDRQESDYVAFSTFERDYIEAQLTRCAGFLNALHPLITSIP